MRSIPAKLVAVCVYLGCALSWAQGNIVELGNAATVPAISDGSKTRAIEINREGTESVTAKRFRQAKVLFKQAIRLDPGLSDAYENLALLSILAGDDVSAEDAARHLLILDPQSYNGRLIAGVAEINQGKFQRGLNSIAALMVQDSTLDLLTATAYGLALEKTGRKAEASRLKRRLGNYVVDDRDALLAGQIFRQVLLRKEAQTWLESSVKRNGIRATPDMLYMLAKTYAEQGRTGDASQLYLRILNIEPSNVNALIQLSELEIAAGDTNKGLSYLYAVKTQAGKDIPSLLEFSQLCMRRRMYIDARDALQEMLAQDPYIGEGWYELGLAQYRIGETDGAEKDFRAALDLDPRDEWSRIALGVVLMSNSHQGEAVREFHRVLAQDLRCGAAYYYLAQAQRGMVDSVLVQDELKKAVLYAGRDARPLAALGQFQFEQRDFVSARKSLSMALELDPTSAIAHYHLASLLRAQGETEKSKSELELFRKYHDEENEKGIVGLVREGKWDYAGFMPAH